MTTTGGRTERPLRRDARRNRELLVRAARDMFGSKGLDAPLEEIARKAGVAVGTLYNRFPTRSALVEAAFLPELEHLLAQAECAANADETWDGFASFVWVMCEHQASDRGLTEVCSRELSDAPGLARCRQRTGEVIERIVARAQAAGDLREDFRPADLAFAVSAVASSTVLATAGLPADAWRRHVTYLLDGFRVRS